MGGAYLRREICVSKLIRLAYGWKEFYRFSLFYFVFEDTVFMYKSPGAYIGRGHLTKRFCVTFLRGLYLEGVIHGGAYFRNFAVWGGPKTGVWLFITDFITRF